MNMFKSGLLVTAACVAALTSIGSAAAQTAPAAPYAGAVDEIVVTARKRSESLISVPVVATAVSGETLQRMGTNDLKSLATMVPGLALGTSILSVGSLVSLRGVGTSALDPGVDASVTLNIDGLALSQGLAYASGMFDVGQVEVLKGPQNLFYGKSSPGGVISLRTADPTDEVEIIGRAGYEFEARERTFETILSGPLSDSVGVRVAMQYGKQDGFFKNSAVAVPGSGASGPHSRRNGNGDSFKIRGTLLFNPSDKFDARFKLNHVIDDYENGGSIQNTLCADGVTPINGRFYVDPTDKCKLDRVVPSVDMDPTYFPGITNGGVPFNKTRQTFGTAELNFHLSPELTLTSQTGYYRAHANSLFNATGSSASMGLFDAVNDFHRRQVTQEVRLASDFETPLNFTVGAFIERGKFSDDVDIAYNQAPQFAAITAGRLYAQKGYKEVEIKTESVFGQLLYKFTPELELAAGARWTNERRSEVGSYITGALVANPGAGVVNTAVFARPNLAAKNLAPEVSLTYRPTSDLTIFANLKRGYKSGSFNVSTPPFSNAATPVAGRENNAFDDEKVQGGEIGMKMRTPDRRFTFESSAFYYKYSGLQVGANVQATAGVTVTRTVNAGSARSYGVEAAMTYVPAAIEGLTVKAAALYNNTKYTSLTNLPCYGGQMVSEGCNLLPAASGLFTAQNRSGLPLVRAPKFSGNFGADYEFDVGGDMSMILGLNNQFQSKSLVNLGYLFYQKSFIKTDLSATLRGPNGKWDVAVIGKNLANKITTGNCSNGNRMGGNAGGTITGGTTRGVAGIDEVGCWADRGREVWVRASLRY